MQSYLQKCMIQVIICSIIVFVMLCFRENTVVSWLHYNIMIDTDVKSLYHQVVTMVQTIL